MFKKKTLIIIQHDNIQNIKNREEDNNIIKVGILLYKNQYRKI